MMLLKDFESYAAKIASARMDSVSSFRIFCLFCLVLNMFVNVCNVIICDLLCFCSVLLVVVKMMVFVVLIKFVATIAFVKYSSSAASTTAL